MTRSILQLITGAGLRRHGRHHRHVVTAETGLLTGPCCTRLCRAVLCHMFTSMSGFEVPPDNARVWRYMDLGRFLWLIHHRAVYFSRPSETLDPWEGVPPPSIARIHHPANVEFSVGRTESLVFSCWHENPDESVAMWRLYTSGVEGVAIQSTVEKLKRWLMHIGLPVCSMAKVRYVDDSPDSEPPSGVLANHIREFEFLLYKRRVYAHEQELRLMTFAPAGDAGLALPTKDLSLLMERIVVSPKYPTWAISALQAIVGSAGLQIQIERSKCDLEPPSFCKGQTA